VEAEATSVHFNRGGLAYELAGAVELKKFPKLRRKLKINVEVEVPGIVYWAEAPGHVSEAPATSTTWWALVPVPSGVVVIVIDSAGLRNSTACAAEATTALIARIATAASISALRLRILDSPSLLPSVCARHLLAGFSKIS
jgi:hypothetical protein